MGIRMPSSGCPLTTGDGTEIIGRFCRGDGQDGSTRAWQWRSQFEIRPSPLPQAAWTFTAVLQSVRAPFLMSDKPAPVHGGGLEVSSGLHVL